MCTNFIPTRNSEWVKSTFGVPLPPDYPEGAYPGYLAPIVLKGRKSDKTACGLARFGLIPAWAKDEKIGRHTYNARSETVASKPSFRSAWAKGQFALVLVDAFFEPNYETGKAVRWRIETADRLPFAIAALWDRWVNAKGEPVVSFTMLTINADAHPIMRQFHKPADEKRTPVVIPKAKYETWLSSGGSESMTFLSLGQMPELISQLDGNMGQLALR